MGNLTLDDLHRLRELLAASSPGAWEVGRKSKKGYYTYIDAPEDWHEFARVTTRMEGCEYDRQDGLANLNLIVETHNMLPQLLALAEQVLTARQEVRDNSRKYPLGASE